MENEIRSPLEREDRENDIDEFIVPGVSLEGMDYKTYLQTLKSGEGREGPKHQEVTKKKEESASGRKKRVTIVTSEEVWRLLKIVAASEGKTVSTYLNDFIMHSLKSQLDQANHYSRTLPDVKDSG